MSDVDYTAVLEDLRRRRQQLDDAIAAIEGLSGASGSSAPGGRAPNNGTEAERPDSFFNLSVREGAVKLLKLRKKALSAVEIREVHSIQTHYLALSAAERKVLLRAADIAERARGYFPPESGADYEWARLEHAARELAVVQYEVGGGP